MMDSREIELFKRKFIIQHNAITMARYATTIYDQHIIHMLLPQLKNSDPVDKVYHVFVKDIEKLTGKEIRHSEVLKSAGNLVKRVYTLKEGENDTLLITIVSSARYIKGAGRVDIRIDPEARPYLFDLKQEFTKYGAFMALSMESTYSIRLYKMLMQFMKTGVFYTSVYNLKWMLDILDPKTGKDKYRNWATLKKRVLDPALKEINERTGMGITCEAIKEGKKFTHLVFKMSKKCPEIDKISGEERARVYGLLTERNGLSEWQARLILKRVDIKDIHATLYAIQTTKNEIKNMGGYTAQVFNDKFNLGLMNRSNAGLMNELNRLKSRIGKA